MHDVWAREIVSPSLIEQEKVNVFCCLFLCSCERENASLNVVD
jgi:hypothetical protein